MSKNVKKVIVFIVSLVVVLIIIGGVYLFLNKGSDDNVPPAPPPSEGAPADVSNSPEPGSTPAVSTVSPENPDNQNTANPSEDVPAPTYTVDVPDGFVREQGDTDIIYYADDKNAFVEFKFIPNTTSQTLSPGFLDSYIDYNDVSYDGINQIENTDLFGRGVTAENESMTGRAILVDRNGGVFAAVIISPKDNSELAEKLMGILQSIKFE